MKAWRYDDSTSGLFLDDVERPQPGPGELSIRVHAVGVTPTERLWYPTIHQKSGEIRRHAVPGHEFSGVVAAAANGVDVAVGTEVFGMNDWFADGALAEFCCTLPSSVTAKPAQLTHEEAASVPIGALTAWQGLFDRAKLQPGERVLIHGGSGSVGVFAIQLARRHGAHVITTASERNRAFLLNLGARQAIDYHTERFEDFAKSVDVIFDTVGGSTLQRSWDLLRPGGRLVTIAASGEAAVDERTKRAFFIVEPNQRQLTEIADLLDSEQLQPVLHEVIPFDDAAEAYIPSYPKRGCGKTVITLVS